jgi:membrane associated rhomboid family serine protease
MFTSMELSITLVLVVITALVSISGFNSQKIIDDLIFYPPAITQRKQWYRFFSCGFIHADWGHLIFNMISLYLFGRFVETQFAEIFGAKGKILYLLMYILALAVSILPTYFKNKNNYHYRSLGASGAVSAVIFAGLLIAPYLEVSLFFIPIGIPGFIFAPLYLIISVIMEKKGGDNVNHSAHIWGALFGLVFVIVVGKLVADFDAITYCIRAIKYYMQAKGWI